MLRLGLAKAVFALSAVDAVFPPPPRFVTFALVPRLADRATYAAKRGGRNRVAGCPAGMQSATTG